MRTIAARVICVAGAAFMMRAELHTDDTGVEVAVLLSLTLLLGALDPARAWQWGLITGLSIPAADLLFGAPQAPARLLPIAAVTTALALAGSYAGAFLGRRLQPS